MKFTKGQLRRIISEEITKHLKEMEVPVGAEIDQFSDDEEDEYGSGAYMYDNMSGRMTARAPRVASDPRALEGYADVGKEIKKLAKRSGMSPMEYLEDLGFSPEVASTLLGRAGEFDDAKLGMYFLPR